MKQSYRLFSTLFLLISFLSPFCFADKSCFDATTELLEKTLAKEESGSDEDVGNDFASDVNQAGSSKMYYTIRLRPDKFKNIRLERNEQATLFTIRDRIQATALKFDFIKTEEEAALYSKVKGSPVKVGEKITASQFENQVIKLYTGVALWYAVRPKFYFRNVDQDDMVQAAMLGLMLAVRGFNPADGMFSYIAVRQFMSKEVYEVINSQSFIRRYKSQTSIVRNSHITKISKELVEKAKKIGAKKPTAQDVANEYNKREYSIQLRITAELVEDVLGKEVVVETIDSLVSSAMNGYNTAGADIFPSTGPTPEHSFTEKEISEMTYRLLKKARLTDKHISVIAMRFDLPINLPFRRPVKTMEDDTEVSRAEVGEAMGISYERARQIEVEALNLLSSAAKRTGEYNSAMALFQ